MIFGFHPLESFVCCRVASVFDTEDSVEFCAVINTTMINKKSRNGERYRVNELS